jgi:hypothetical protein
MLLARLLLPVVLLRLSACALIPPSPPPLPTEPQTSRCLDLYGAVDQAVAQHGVPPSYPSRIQGFPYLRVNRFLADYRNQPLDTLALKVWLENLADLDHEARQVELNTLPAAVLVELTARYVTQGTLPSDLVRCSQLLRAYDLSQPARLELLRARAVVPEDYLALNRVLGLYPLTALPVRYGVFRWQEETRRVFALPLASLPITGKLQRFQPPQGLASESVSLLSRDVLGIPILAPASLTTLFAAHAPVWEIDVTGDFDRPGTPHWREDGIPTVNPDEPVVYRYPSYSRWQGRVLLQLNYLIWFAERPRTGPVDMLGGALDGLIWRVTLDEQGLPLLYDSIHTCGCYHLFFPSSNLRLRPEARQEAEPPLLAQGAPRLSKGERITLRISSGSHYIQRVYADLPTGSSYAWRDYAALYAVRTADGSSRSLFGPDGLVPGTERGERWLLWPMGVPSPGAMRERSHHVTAFLGRRHFDDPGLLEKLFEPVEARRSLVSMPLL